MTHRMGLQTWALLCLLGSALAASIGEDRYQELLSLKSNTPESVQRDAVVELVKRVLPNHAHLIEVVVDGSLAKGPLDHFKVESVDKIIRVSGSTGVAAANGFHYYLKYVANCSVSWTGDQLALPEGRLPMPTGQIEMTIRDKFRHYINACTVSYSMVWWNWTRWEREIDWMALRGINLPLAFIGQEMVFRRTFQRFNLTIPQIDDYFTGPAFLAWNRMGNIQTWSGPLSEHWHQHQMELQKKILKRMRSFGMFPVVPGFAGHVPRQLAQVLPDASIHRLREWGDFGKNFSFTYFLQPEDPNFIKVGKAYIEEYIELYGTDHFYSIDLFNEEVPTSDDADYLKKCSRRVYDSIAEADPKGIWVMQSWLFFREAKFWKEKQVKAMVTSVPLGKLLLLDLSSEIHPLYPHTNGYYGQPFIWCMLHNFGGTLGMQGALNRVNERVFDARKKYPNMIGIGLVPEAIEQNGVVYDYMAEVTWNEDVPDMARWMSHYARSRYGVEDSRLDQAWQLLRISVYTDPIGVSNHGRYTINVRPQLKFKSAVWYNQHNVSEALKQMAMFVNSNRHMLRSEPFVYDLVDVTRQTLQLMFDYYYKELISAYNKRNVTELQLVINSMDHVLDLTETVLQSSKPFLLSTWIESARQLGRDSQEQDYHEWQARNQITVWGPDANVIDYATKQWSGVVKYFYKPRWKLFFTWLHMDLLEDNKFDQKKFATECLDLVEMPFTYAKRQDLVKEPDTSKLIDAVNEVVHLVVRTIDCLSPDVRTYIYYYHNDAQQWRA